MHAKYKVLISYIQKLRLRVLQQTYMQAGQKLDAFEFHPGEN